MAQILTVGGVADRLGVAPRVISNLFYGRRLRCDLCPIVGGRRLIPENYVEFVAAELRRSGHRIQPLAGGGGL